MSVSQRLQTDGELIDPLTPSSLLPRAPSNTSIRGQQKASASTLSSITSQSRSLSRTDNTLNRKLDIDSNCVSKNETTAHRLPGSPLIQTPAHPRQTQNRQLSFPSSTSQASYVRFTCARDFLIWKLDERVKIESGQEVKREASIVRSSIICNLSYLSLSLCVRRRITEPLFAFQYQLELQATLCRIGRGLESFRWVRRFPGIISYKADQSTVL